MAETIHKVTHREFIEAAGKTYLDRFTKSIGD